MIALADCNNFYVSCERVFNPSIKNEPVLVLSNNDGCIIARSNESKKLGFKMGEPIFKKRKFIEKNKIKIFSTNFSLYGDMSNRVMSILMKESPEIEIYSIDEAFLNLKGIEEKEKYAVKLRKKVLQWTGIPISIGIGSTKTLSKIASLIAKTNKQGVYILKSKSQIEKTLKKINISSIWGIGKNHAQKLNYYKINNAYELTKINSRFLKEKMSINMLKVQEELKGKQRYLIDKNPKNKKNICTSRSFYKEIQKYEELEKKIASYAARSAEKLRQQKGCAQTITVFIQTSRFKIQKYSKSKSKIFDVATNDSMEIIEQTQKSLKKIYKKKYKYKKAGVVLGGIISQEKVQMNIFDKLNREKRKKIMKAMDRINKTNGKETIKIATQGTQDSWTTKQQSLSPSYTTKWKDLLKVN